MTGKLGFTNLELNHEHQLFNNKYDIDAPADAGQHKLEKHMATPCERSKHGL